MLLATNGNGILTILRRNFAFKIWKRSRNSSTRGTPLHAAGKAHVPAWRRRAGRIAVVHHREGPVLVRTGVLGRMGDISRCALCKFLFNVIVTGEMQRTQERCELRLLKDWYQAQNIYINAIQCNPSAQCHAMLCYAIQNTFVSDIRSSQYGLATYLDSAFARA
jgi:hypothetical protein